MGKVQICGIDTSTLPKISAKECDELLLKIKNGDKDARDLFLRANMRLVLSCVGRFSKSAESADDLFQVGMVGLLKSLENFDVNLDVRFSTYAVPMIIGEMRRAIRDRTTVKVSRSMRDTAYKALKAREELSRFNANDPTMVEIAEEIGVPLSEVACALDAGAGILLRARVQRFGGRAGAYRPTCRQKGNERKLDGKNRSVRGVERRPGKRNASRATALFRRENANRDKQTCGDIASAGIAS